MQIAKTFDDINSLKKENPGRIAFVPTMGALHKGHLSLIQLAKNHGDQVIVSIFVNPTQFAPNEDFDSYPRDIEKDAKMLSSEDVNILFIPTNEVIYPNGYNSEIKAKEAAKGLETDFRPHFFDGVVNVVNRLFSAVKPDIAIFGEKDFQQLQVIREMVETLNLPIEIIGAPIARDEYGLALSSRNTYLSKDELKIARTLNVVLRNTAITKDYETAKSRLLSNGFDKVDYIKQRWGRVLGAAWVGGTRLIDNVEITDF